MMLVLRSFLHTTCWNEIDLMGRGVPRRVMAMDILVLGSARCCPPASRAAACPARLACLKPPVWHWKICQIVSQMQASCKPQVCDEHVLARPAKQSIGSLASLKLKRWNASNNHWVPSNASKSFLRIHSVPFWTAQQPVSRNDRRSTPCLEYLVSHSLGQGKTGK